VGRRSRQHVIRRHHPLKAEARPRVGSGKAAWQLPGASAGPGSPQRWKRVPPCYPRVAQSRRPLRRDGDSLLTAGQTCKKKAIKYPFCEHSARTTRRSGRPTDLPPGTGRAEPGPGRAAWVQVHWGSASAGMEVATAAALRRGWTACPPEPDRCPAGGNALSFRLPGGE
jgi:hypothetical protein